MRAILIEDDGGLRWGETPDPALRNGEVLVEVHATALNRADLSQRAGRYPPPPGESEILGLELSGIVRELGPGADASPFRPGDRVCALVAGGGYAELAAVPASLLMPVPQGWSFAQAAALPEVFLTAFLNLFLEAGLRPGERVLVHGAGSGVGTAAIQLAARAGCTVHATAGRGDKLELARELGATQAIDYTKEDFAAAVRARLEADGAAGVDVVLDMVGGPYLARELPLLATGGRIVFIATLGGAAAELDIRALMSRRARLIGSTLRSRPTEEKARIRDAFVERFWDDLETGRIAPVIDRVLPVERAEEAHEVMRANDNLGKIVLEVAAGGR